MKHFIIIQVTIVGQEIKGNNTINLVENIVRQIKAKNEEEAIGKFIIATKDIKAIEKLDLECYDLSELKSVE